MRGSSTKPRQKFQVHNYEQRKPFKKILKAGILNLAHDKQFFTKKSEKKRLAKSAGRQRWLKKLRETPGPHQMKNNYRRKKGH